MADTQTTLFADGMLGATVANGVARITLAQSGADGKPIAVGQLCVPLVQLPALANGLVNLLRQVEAKAKEAQQQRQAGAAEGSGDSIGVPPPGSFRFQS